MRALQPGRVARGAAGAGRRAHARLTARAAALAAAPLLALAMTACGGHTASRHDVLVRANAICADTFGRVRAVTAPQGASASALAAYLRRVRPIVDSEAHQLAALPRPTEQRPTLDAFVSEVQRAARAYDTAQTAAARGDGDGARNALASLRSNRATALAARYGLRQCTGSVATLGR